LWGFEAVTSVTLQGDTVGRGPNWKLLTANPSPFADGHCNR